MRSFLNWIACHSVALVFTLFLIIALVLRESLFGISQSSSQSVVQESPQHLEQPTAAQLPNVPEQTITSAIEAEQIQQQKKYAFRPDVEPVDEQALASARETSGNTPGLLQQARRAYWNEQYDQAVALYHQFIQVEPDNPDGYGELGNLLSSRGEFEQASQAYRSASRLLREKGDTAQAEQLQEVLEAIRIIQQDGK